LHRVFARDKTAACDFGDEASRDKIARPDRSRIRVTVFPRLNG
jgi:hypothetical protein